jgi:hypothetical protein
MVEILAWDPTHDRPADLRYLTVSVGRDYYDVAPVSGTPIARRTRGGCRPAAVSA